jgi:hypothetical protein
MKRDTVDGDEAETAEHGSRRNTGYEPILPQAEQKKGLSVEPARFR